MFNLHHDNFENGKIHLLDLEISNSGIDIYRKLTCTGQYTHFDSQDLVTQNGMGQVDSSKDSSNHNTNEVSTRNDFSDDAWPKIWIRIPFLGNKRNFWLEIL